MLLSIYNFVCFLLSEFVTYNRLIETSFVLRKEFGFIKLIKPFLNACTKTRKRVVMHLGAMYIEFDSFNHFSINILIFFLFYCTCMWHFYYYSMMAFALNCHAFQFVRIFIILTIHWNHFLFACFNYSILFFEWILV